MSVERLAVAALERPGHRKGLGAGVKNHLLRALPPAVRARVFPQLKLVKLALGEILYETGSTFEYAYFPVDSIISMLYVMKNGESAEIAIVGFEGVVGLALFMGGGTTPTRAIVQNAGHAYRLKASVVRKEFGRSGEFQRVLLRYTHSLLAQMTQTAACNRHHTVDQQFCRWLLMSLDRLPDNRVTLTQKLIANMLGISMPAVRTAAAKLEDRDVIRYFRGDITVLDRPKLERICCECYGVVRKEFDRLLKPPRAIPVLPLPAAA